jgi:hypothetical protein
MQVNVKLIHESNIYHTNLHPQTPTLSMQVDIIKLLHQIKPGATINKYTRSLLLTEASAYQTLNSHT